MRRKTELFAAVLIAAVAFAVPGCSGEKKKKGTGESFQLDKSRLLVKNGIRLDVEIAKTEAAREKAPPDLYALCESCGLLVAYGSETSGRFSTEEMKMDVDLVWMNHFTVIGTVSNLRSPAGGGAPSTVLSPSAVTEFLLLPPGAIQRLKIEQGDNYRMDRS